MCALTPASSTVQQNKPHETSSGRPPPPSMVPPAPAPFSASLTESHWQRLLFLFFLQANLEMGVFLRRYSDPVGGSRLREVLSFLCLFLRTELTP